MIYRRNPIDKFRKVMSKVKAINIVQEWKLYPRNDYLEVESQVIHLDDIDDDFFDKEERKLSQNGKLLGTLIFIFIKIHQIYKQ